MSIGRYATSRLGRAPSQAATETQVDVTPVMNVFVILIPFLLSMAVFSHLTVLRFALPGSTAGTQANPALPLTVALTDARAAVLRGDRILVTIPRAGAGHDFARLAEALAGLRAQAGGDEERIVIAVDDGQVFAEVVRCMDTCRDAGFAGIGLAEGTRLDAAALPATGSAGSSGRDAATGGRP